MRTGRGGGGGLSWTWARAAAVLLGMEPAHIFPRALGNGFAQPRLLPKVQDSLNKVQQTLALLGRKGCDPQDVLLWEKCSLVGPLVRQQILGAGYLG